MDSSAVGRTGSEAAGTPFAIGGGRAGRPSGRGPLVSPAWRTSSWAGDGVVAGHVFWSLLRSAGSRSPQRDIFMYRGDIPFCTEECRREQIEMDEEMERKDTTSKKVGQRAPSPKGVESPPRPPKARAGSILAG
ncbi:hypothetical protein PR202_ga19234 [Eleusine coracana subsp. coracana]|uniref:FLZ-type domain-containing protein n=1 Tax=Eleusine coracana subsp. coracana TaxID=191504 RepID=A0AAV5CVV9_ELECO|nr:hypothetical protein PR202_ga19234 [Eleusine coracana subsp. coracana]